MNSLLAYVIGGIFSISAATIVEAVTYNIDRTVGDGFVFGTIETNGKLGALREGDIVSWSFTIDSPILGGGRQTISSVNPSFFQISAGLQAYSDDLTFDYNESDFTFFQDDVSRNGWCLSGPGGCGSINGPGSGDYLFYSN
jgi:hypothetical protein